MGVNISVLEYELRGRHWIIKTTNQYRRTASPSHGKHTTYVHCGFEERYMVVRKFLELVHELRACDNYEPPVQHRNLKYAALVLG